MLIDPNCQVCRHQKRLQIDLSVQAQGQRATAKVYGVSRQAIQRHLDKGHSAHKEKLPHGTKIEPIIVVAREIPDKPPLVDPALAYDGVGDTTPDKARGKKPSKGKAKPKAKAEPEAPPAAEDRPPSEAQPLPEAQPTPAPAEPPAEPATRAKKARRKGKAPPLRPVVDRRTKSTTEHALAAIHDGSARKAYVGKLLRTGTFNGMPTLERLRGCWPDLSMLQLAEIVAQAAMEADFLRGTRQARRLVVLAKADKIYRDALDKKDLRMALKALEFSTRVDGVSAEPDLVASLAASQAWTITARVLQARFPDAFDAIHAELVAEETRKRQALSPPTLEVNDGAE